jgi:osmoprotectant transport system permease protein
MGLFDFILNNPGRVLEKLQEHIVIFFISWLLAVFAGLAISIAISRKHVKPRVADAVVSFTSAAQSVPSIAVIAVVFLVTGIGMEPAIIALFIYSLVPVVFNATSAFKTISPALKEAATGMGMSDRQILWKVEIPVILPQIFSGIRTAATINIGTTTIASAVGAGGLGELIFLGLRLINPSQIFAGAFPAALLAIVIDLLLNILQNRITSEGVKLEIAQNSQ